MFVDLIYFNYSSLVHLLDIDVIWYFVLWHFEEKTFKKKKDG